MVVELYLDLLSQPCRSVYIFAKKNNIPFEFKHVELLKGEHLSEEFYKVNLLRKVHALKDGNFTLAESIAILLYLSRKFNTPDHWYPSDVQKRARVDEYLSWQHTRAINVYGPCMSLSRLERAVEDLKSTMKQFEEKFLQDKPFIVGNEISLADLVAIVELMQVSAARCVQEGRRKLSIWLSLSDTKR
uniref:Glutathione transferase n=1 Tax=Sphenodon punctatus TaxID=8508 RepID=A0A8D0H9F7_SPHPU